MLNFLRCVILLCSIIAVSCNKDKIKAPKASFLVVNNVTLKTNYPTQGSNSHKITDIWYYVNGEFRGVFPIGSVMPITADDNADIILFAGIKNNGISSTRLPYAAYASKKINLDIVPGETYTLSPQFEYNSSSYFYYHDDFDLGAGSGSFFISDGDSALSNTRNFDISKSFGGIGGSVFMSMSNDKPTARLLQTNGTYLPAGGAVVYVELNYKCNQIFTVGIIGGTSDKRGAITLNNTDGEWNKVYIQLTNIVSVQPFYPSYKVYIEASKLVQTPEIYIDNVKLIYQ